MSKMCEILSGMEQVNDNVMFSVSLSRDGGGGESKGSCRTEV